MREVTVRVKRSAVVSAPPEDVHAVLANVPDSGAHFPEVTSLTESDGVYTWVLREKGGGGMTLQITYACRYVADPDTHAVTWTPVSEVGNARVSGSWSIAAEGSGTRFTLDNELTVLLNVSRLVAKVAKPLVQRGYTNQLERYVANLAATFEGGDGRV